MSSVAPRAFAVTFGLPRGGISCSGEPPRSAWVDPLSDYDADEDFRCLMTNPRPHASTTMYSPASFSALPFELSGPSAPANASYSSTTTSPSSFPELAATGTAARKGRVDWRETAEAHLFVADVPGLAKEEVKVEVERDVLVLRIRAEKKKTAAAAGGTFHLFERAAVKVDRSFRLPEGAKVAEAKAAMEKGVLTVTVPKEPPKAPVVTALEISGTA